MPDDSLIKAELTPSPRYLKRGYLFSYRKNGKPCKRADINVFAWVRDALNDFDSKKVNIRFSIEVVK